MFLYKFWLFFFFLIQQHEYLFCVPCCALPGKRAKCAVVVWAGSSFGLWKVVVQKGCRKVEAVRGRGSSTVKREAS